MPPRKRAAAAASRKPNQGNQPSQPSKYGIQHFFERHSQSQAAAPSVAAAGPSKPHPVRNPNHPSANDQLPHSPDIAPADGGEESSHISPSVVKSSAKKRFKFSPGMLIKQSQDDGVDEVTWKISPVNERLHSISSRRLSGKMKGFCDTSRPQLSTLRPCSSNQDPRSNSKFEKWICSESTVTSDKPLELSENIFKETGAFPSQQSNVDSSAVDFKRPFRTPPSMPYESKEFIGSSGEMEQLGSQKYQKTLLELLDQVEDAITDEPVPGNQKECEHRHATNAKNQPEPSVSGRSIGAMSKTDPSYTHYDTFLVLEVSEKHKSSDPWCCQSPVKIIRLLNEQSGQERILHLCDEWFYSVIGPGDTLNVVGEFDDAGRCTVDRVKNLIIVHPDILLSGTRVASSFTCPRRAVLDERLKTTEHSSVALLGTLLHQLFQAGLLKDLPSRQFLEEYAGIIIQRNIEDIYACGANEKDFFSKLIDAIPRILNWLTCFKEKEEGNSVPIDFGQLDGVKGICISEVMDIEEMAQAPTYGMKGVIDASVCVKVTSSNDESYETIMPLEFKTGKRNNGQAAMEHSAQVILYTLLMSERYLKRDINIGLLYYLQTDQTRGVKVQRSDLVGLIMRRNELATDVLKASRTRHLPSMLQNLALCKVCRHLNICTIFHKAYGGDSNSSGLGDFFDDLAGHLTVSHSNFLKHWVRLVDLEAQASKVNKKERFSSHTPWDENSTRSSSYILVDFKNEFSGSNSSRNDRFKYCFVLNEQKAQDQYDFSKLRMSDHGSTLKRGDHVVLSTESGHLAVATGVIDDIGKSHISVFFSRRLRLPICEHSLDLGRLGQEVWRINKDEFASSFTTMRYNLALLFTQSLQFGRLRKMIVDLEVPRFDSEGTLSQDPALSYIRSQKNLNDDQRRAIQKILAAKDYALILGMPGTGKTSTMVHAVKALLMRGSSILLTSYTNLAIDTLLIKLKNKGIDFVRIGRREAVHSDILEYCIPAENIGTVNDIKEKMELTRVVGVTCLGINHPLLTNKKFDICIIDEAGQTTLPISLGPLMLASRFVLVGDHYQLPPLVQSVEARENGMSVSLFCRLSETHPQAISALQCQYRMCAGIMELSNALIYGNRLRCGSSEVADAKLKLSCSKPVTLWLQEILNANKPVIFASTDMLPANEERENTTVVNYTEAYIVAEITKELIKRGIAGDDIGIISPYNSQVNIIRQILDASIEVQTIDKYQGRDKDCILLSFVRSLKNSGSCISSLLGEWHRINVAITRAKKKLIMVGSRKTLSKIPLLKLLIEKVSEQDGIVHLSNNDIPCLEKLKKSCNPKSVQLMKS
ncbi:DNA replication ATP-dependent helicase/nuclease JHS1 [Zingiber officinale]|uniref:DNA replication ATP-dependent helicase/nuclease JHS1 n=1 Tax=Zingiber officinale TaxID=94328 RepID=UPI001C4C97AC|nr:DNA replication ATP-dependent helicase/nuclease JHS1 [Zingiber officinale]